MQYQDPVYLTIMWAHIATVLPCVVLGALSFWLAYRMRHGRARSGRHLHRVVGGAYMILMVITALLSLLLPAFSGPRLLGHFGWIHSFSFLTLFLVPAAYRAIRRGNVARHQRMMIGLYIGALLIAGGFTLVPGRFMHALVFG